MDYISLINSRDIREHLYEIGYRLSDLQKFYLIDCCHWLSYPDKVKKLIQLQDSCTDLRLEISGFDEIRSLKGLLKTVIKQREQALADFKNPYHADEMPCIYLGYLCVRTKHDDRITSENDTGSLAKLFSLCGLFQSAEEALKATLTFAANHNSSLIKIEKRLMGAATPTPLFEAIYDAAGNLFSLNMGTETSLSYKDISINLPLPFSRGDLLIKPDRRFYCGDDLPCQDCINLIYDSQLFCKNNFQKGHHSCFIQGYSLSSGCQLPFKTNIEHEYDLEYSRSKLTGNDALLIPFSLFLKGTLYPDEVLEYIDGLKKANLNQSLEKYLKECMDLKDLLMD